MVYKLVLVHRALWFTDFGVTESFDSNLRGEVEEAVANQVSAHCLASKCIGSVINLNLNSSAVGNIHQLLKLSQSPLCIPTSTMMGISFPQLCLTMTMRIWPPTVLVVLWIWMSIGKWGSGWGWGCNERPQPCRVCQNPKCVNIIFNMRGFDAIKMW